MIILFYFGFGRHLFVRLLFHYLRNLPSSHTICELLLCFVLFFMPALPRPGTNAYIYLSTRIHARTDAHSRVRPRTGANRRGQGWERLSECTRKIHRYTQIHIHKHCTHTRARTKYSLSPLPLPCFPTDVGMWVAGCMRA